MTHRQYEPSIRSGLPVFVLALVAVLLLGVVWTTVTGGDEELAAPADTEAPAADDTQGSAEPTVVTAAGPDTSVATDDSVPTTNAPVTLAPITGFRFETVAEGLQQPTAIAAPPGDDRLFIVERIGRIKLLRADGTVADESFLNITDRVLANGIEQGLLGLAFHPDYGTNGRFFVYYVNKDGQRTLSEFSVSTASPDQANRESEKVFFSYPQPEGSTDIRHYGGGLNFGPDGYLWVSVGDGADSRDQGQDPNTIFAALLRLDVDSGDPYGTPIDNPFANGGGAAEVWAYGLRNPWRFTVDHETRLVYVGDVGQGAREEINVLAIDGDAGANLGWANVEGTLCFFEGDCDPASYHLPTIEYDHDKGCSVTGGVVYRGTAIPELDGHYFYADWCNQWIESFLLEGGVVTDERDWTAEYNQAGQPNGFGNDSDGELYVATFGGSVVKLVADRG
ncbi:MAG: PQQ-dependent sugar dehydrogenase [Acidimicrobiia bacterium]|nr:MAG: PQQ-dependent sugar dehydrogenase [Acidimicrobiia bacterium]